MIQLILGTLIVKKMKHSSASQTMLLQCANMYVGTGHSNTKYNMKYILFGLSSLKDTL